MLLRVGPDTHIVRGRRLAFRVPILEEFAIREACLFASFSPYLSVQSGRVTNLSLYS